MKMHPKLIVVVVALLFSVAADATIRCEATPPCFDCEESDTAFDADYRWFIISGSGTLTPYGDYAHYLCPNMYSGWHRIGVGYNTSPTEPMTNRKVLQCNVGI